MATVTAPTSVQHPPFRRSTTVPTRLVPRSAPAHNDDASSDDNSEETLFTHPAAKIVSFSEPSRRAQNQDAGTLPWTSRSERVISAGPLRLYRLRGSVAFLQSGSLLLSLLPRSQCWCVDGESKFAMRIKFLIYRIELPFSNAEDRQKVEELKEVLKKVLQYETTPCPFTRGFTVDTTLVADQPRKRHLIGPYIRANKWELNDGWRREGASRFSSGSSGKSSPDISDEDAVARMGQDDGLFDTDEAGRSSPISPESPLPEEVSKLSLLRPTPPIEHYRSVTAPAQLPTLENITISSEFKQQKDTDMSPNSNDLSGPLYNPSIITKLNPASEFDPIPIILSHVEDEISTESHPRNISAEARPTPTIQSTSTSMDGVLEKKTEPVSPSSITHSIEVQDVFNVALDTEPGPASLETSPPLPETSQELRSATPPQQPQISKESPPELTADVTPGIKPTQSHSSSPPTTEEDDIFRPSTTTFLPPTFPEQSPKSQSNPSTPIPKSKTPTRRSPSTDLNTLTRTRTSAPTPPPSSAYLISRTFSLLLGPPSGLVTAVRQLASRVFPLTSPPASPPSRRSITSKGASQPVAGGGRVGGKSGRKKLPGYWPESDSDDDSASLRSKRSLVGDAADDGDSHLDSDFDAEDDTAGKVEEDAELRRRRMEEAEDEDVEEDDYGVPLVSPVRKIKERWGAVGRAGGGAALGASDRGARVKGGSRKSGWGGGDEDVD